MQTRVYHRTSRGQKAAQQLRIRKLAHKRRVAREDSRNARRLVRQNTARAIKGLPPLAFIARKNPPKAVDPAVTP